MKHGFIVILDRSVPKTEGMCLLYRIGNYLNVALVK